MIALLGAIKTFFIEAKRCSDHPIITHFINFSWVVSAFFQKSWNCSYYIPSAHKSLQVYVIDGREWRDLRATEQGKDDNESRKIEESVIHSGIDRKYLIGTIDFTFDSNVNQFPL